MSRRRSVSPRATPALAAVLALVASVALALAAPPARVVFLTNYVFLGRHAPFFLGVDRGFYREAGFEVEIAPSTGRGYVVAALEGGQADFGIVETAPLVQAVAKGARVKAFGVYMDASTSGLAALEPHPMPASVLGKTIAASAADSARVILPVVLRLHGLDPSRVEWIAADPSLYLPLLLQGRARLVTASIDSDVPSFRRIAERQGRTIHFSSFAEWGYDVFGYLLVTQAERIAARPDEVRAFAAATARAVAAAIDDPEEAAASLVRHHPTLDRELVLAQWRASMAAIDTPFVEEHGYGRASRERLARSIELVAGAFGLEASIAPEDFYAGALVEPAASGEGRSR